MKTFVTRRVVTRLLWVLGFGVAGFLVYAWRSAIPPADPPSADSFSADTIRRGAQLAALGDCATCHTAPGGETFAGGRPVPTTLVSFGRSNPPSDLTTGIGRWAR